MLTLPDYQVSEKTRK